MRKLDWHAVALEPGILRENVPEPNRLVAWLPGDAEAGARIWERIGNVPGSESELTPGLFASAATLIRVRQPIRGILGKLLHGWRRANDAPAWTLPNGATAEQFGERRTDVLLVWTDDTDSIDEARLRERWPAGQRFQRLGNSLYLVAGVAAPAADAAPTGDSQAVANQLLEKARQAGDCGREVSALTDLGVLALRNKETPRALALLREALEIARQLEDRSHECDVLNNLGAAYLSAGQLAQARDCVEQELACARAACNPFSEKTALTNLGDLAAGLRDHERALEAYQMAFDLARATDDRAHQADLQWYLAVQHAELGQREATIACGQAAIDLLKEWDNPHVGKLVEALQDYQSGAGALADRGPAGKGISFSAGVPSMGARAGQSPSRGPGMMRMAFSAVKSMAKFVATGMKTVPKAAYQRRLQTCSTCEHHTGVRCKLCGCFTSVKAWLPHEHCPIGKWPK
jgi:tetratricopeptide (TPR) repeat protein